MSTCSHIALMAEYNQWMNNKLYTAARSLPTEALAAERPALLAETTNGCSPGNDGTCTDVPPDFIRGLAYSSGR